MEGTVLYDLLQLQEEAYRDFSSALMPTVDQKTVLGIRTPLLRRYAKSIGKSEKADSFLQELPHTYFEERMLHGFLIEGIQDYTKALQAIEAFLPYIDNWAVCDSVNPRVFAKHKSELSPVLSRWMQSTHPYTVRYGIGMRMRYYLDSDYQSDYTREIASIRSDHYYVNMMIAWYFATALAKQYGDTLPYLQNHALCDFVHAKTIQKALDSYRITAEQKKYLRTLKRKKG